ncbi:hypothetical protein [Clostridium cellulovorans]|uniref:Uncharacterized protein n=1 Tax=Clostridium cellulovorans (strain ATCC 35296 / DSM 3052 / OCM 3 / 743B) TaxID=573061 RepID=D9SSA5_CLOC7|nr:hypothetical protein [Clostridium cellulovorans]ADL52552.1 hypothetical protein Clocel_2856 [Clostridium cellulovorans 743B]
MINLANYEFLSLILFPNRPDTDSELATTLKFAFIYIKELLDFDLTIQGFLPFKLIVEKEIHCILSKTQKIILRECNSENSLLSPTDQILFLLIQFDMTILFFVLAQFDSVQNACLEKQIFSLMSMLQARLYNSLDQYILDYGDESE